MNRRVIRNLRLKESLSQTEFAERIGMSQQTISDIERGAKSITDRTRIKVLTAFDFTPELLETLERLSLFEDDEEV